ncbi:MAG: hypothetical protein Q7S98_00430 [Deltaproteobacteria bacterium]|nr:hypothetical protein [Deltaproteobacteria bacterium]
MNRKHSLRSLLFCCLILASCVPVPTRKTKGPTTIVGQTGMMISPYGMTLGAEYASELDHLVEGYKIITISLTNNSMDQIHLDPSKDKWVIETNSGKRLKATNSFGLKNHKGWSELPLKTRELMEYPLFVPIGYSQTFDLFIKGKADLKRFRSISYTNVESGLTFQVLTAN